VAGTVSSSGTTWCGGRSFGWTRSSRGRCWPQWRYAPNGCDWARWSRRWRGAGPWVVAKQLATLDHLSCGRAVLGVGLGAPAVADFADLGEPDGARERATRLDEGLAVLGGLLPGPVQHQDEHFAVRTNLLPRPVQRPRPPIWVAGIAPHRRPLQRAARMGGSGSRGLRHSCR
jgi:hypothetical protein